MYTIIGGDQQEHGPVSAEHVLQWIAEGRAIASTPCRAEGTTAWRPLSDFPEFAGAFRTSAAIPPTISPPPPAHIVNEPDRLATEILARRGEFRIGDCLSRGWDLVLKNFWLLVGASFVGSLVEGVPFLFGAMQAGLFWLVLKLLRGQPAEFSDSFAGFDQAFVPALLAGILFSVLACLGFCLCIIPGLFLVTVWMFTWPLLLDRKLNAWEAMEVSRKVSTPHFWPLLGLLLVNGLLCCLGVLGCYVGLFVAMAWTIAATACAYEDLFNPPTRPAA